MSGLPCLNSSWSAFALLGLAVMAISLIDPVSVSVLLLFVCDGHLQFSINIQIFIQTSRYSR